MTALRLVGRVLFSVWVWVSCFSWMLVGSVLSMLLLAVGFPYTKVHVWLMGPVFGHCVLLCLTRFRVHYHPDFDPEVRSVFTQNHINLLDGMVAARAIPHAFSGLMNAWQFKIPIYGWMMTLSKGIGIRRDGKESVVEQISRAAAERKRIGMSVLTFPEGHRTSTGEVGPFKRGVFLMARNAEMPIVPIAVKGLYEVNNKRIGPLFSPWRRVDVFVGPQFPLDGLTNGDIGDFADTVREYLVDCLDAGGFPSATPEPRSRGNRRTA